MWNPTLALVNYCLFHDSLDQFSFYLDTLTMKDLKILVNELSAVKDKWFDLGVQLNMTPPDLNSIQIQYHNNPSRCLSEMLSQWLSITTPPPTWQTVVDALYCPAISRPLVAQDISKKYCTQSTGSYASYE